MKKVDDNITNENHGYTNVQEALMSDNGNENRI